MYTKAPVEQEKSPALPSVAVYGICVLFTLTRLLFQSDFMYNIALYYAGNVAAVVILGWDVEMASAASIIRSMLPLVWVWVWHRTDRLESCLVFFRATDF